MISKGEAMRLRPGQTIYNTKLTNADGTPLRARVMGKPKEWKKDPTRFRVPICHGLRDYGELTNENCGAWTTEGARLW